MFIGLAALIVFGPRRLPEMARKIGKTMAEFRRSTDEFKNTWQQEIDLEGGKQTTEMLTDLQTVNTIKSENTISRKAISEENDMRKPDLPEIREINKADFESNLPVKEIKKFDQPKISNKTAEKRDWL